MNKLLPLLLLSILCLHANGQLCQGSLGDPIVNITFGSGSNPGPQLSSATTNYSFYPSDCPNDGQYTVRSNTSMCFSNSWHSITSDHTGNAGGYFMLVNASFQPGAFYIDTVKALCKNTTYEFAAWIMNVMVPSGCSGNSIRPNLTFTLEKTDGTILKSFKTGDIAVGATPQWNQYGFYFATPTDASVIVLRIVNNAPGGCGNDLALDDITFRPCGPMLSPSITGQPTTTTDLCEGDSSTFTFSCHASAGYNNPYFQWQQSANNGSSWTDIPGANDTLLTRNFPASTKAGRYQYRLAVSEFENKDQSTCKIVSVPLTVDVHAVPAIKITTNSPVCEGANLSVSASGGSTYNWTDRKGFSFSNAAFNIGNAQLKDGGWYYVDVSNSFGCKSNDSIHLVVNPVPVATTTFMDTTICPNSSIVFNGSGGTSYQWQPATGLSKWNISDPVASPADTTVYSLFVGNVYGCADTAFIQVNVPDPITANAGPDKVMKEGEAVQLTGEVSGTGIHYYWSPATFINDPYSLTPLVNPPAATAYVLHAVSDYGCGTVTDTVFVTVYKNVVVPNVFSPNGDGINDTWQIPALAVYPGCRLTIFNRYGQPVYESKDYEKPWDGMTNGKPLPAGAYYYVIDLNRGLPTIKGSVVILR